MLELISGDRDGSNRYVNIFFDATEQFTAFRMINTTTRAFEVDNIVVGLNSAVNVPTPGTLAILGLGLLSIRFTRKAHRHS
ncbi:PEP-CTERM sorting domain-containing protein [Arsukibacterium indicum]|uniref:PEP-CTERM sorting domain-containing protein n=1 Tax=Arsukibacterium indicum TaxID=2848612 RepID=A0ABS6MIA8_9GAMM|nr:PEP-CTERM sorting domain-containing protein [Arsukibacterium indicum]MBV2128551.1 PEP-CTERM sorting domain-containing protein [Arsukibacterium indicum]